MANDRFDFSHLIAFEKAAESGNFTRAATSLGLSQPALSHRIRLLEESVGQRLFSRQHKGVRLTPEGEILLEAVSGSMARIRQAVSRLQQERGHQRIRISVDFAFGSLWLMPRLGRIDPAMDNVDLQIRSGHKSPEQHMQDSDIAFVLADPGQLPPHARRLLREEVTPVCTPSFLAAHPEAADPGRMSGLPLIHNETPVPGAWFTWRDWIVAQGHDWLPGAHQSYFTTYQLVLQAALDGRGMALGWSGLVDDLLKSGQLVAPCREKVRSNRWYLAVLSGDQPSLPARNLLAALEKIAGLETGAAGP